MTATAATTTKPTTTTPATNSKSGRSTVATCAFKLSNFKPEFSGKPDEDAEVHLLCSDDWMNAHHFIEILSHIIGRSKVMVPLIKNP